MRRVEKAPHLAQEGGILAQLAHGPTALLLQLPPQLLGLAALPVRVIVLA